MGIWDAMKTVFGPGKLDETEKLLKEFQRIINYRFNDADLLRVALTHRSFAKSVEGEWLPSNERLEFLGDSVLGLVVSEFLYSRYSNKSEGGLTKLKSLLVNETTLFRTAEMIDLGRFIILSHEEDRAGGRKRPSINADAFEAVIGAIFIDGGLIAVKQIVNRYILSQVESIAADKTFRNYKGELLEFLQARGSGLPRYEVSSEEGPDHDKTFIVVAYCNGDCIGTGSGSSKKDAEQKAAAQALKKLQSE